MIELWGRHNAYNVQKVLWLLAELGLEFEHHEIGSEPGDLETDAFRALNPHARVPVLRDGASVLWESNTILRYLAAEHGGASWWDTDAYQRSLAERWMDWELCKLQEDFIDLFWSFYRTPEAHRDPARIDAAAARCAAQMALLDQQLSQSTWLAGERFGIADICCGVCLYRYFTMGFDVAQPPQLMRWYAALRQRPAYQQVVMQSYDELYGRETF